MLDKYLETLMLEAGAMLADEQSNTHPSEYAAHRILCLAKDINAYVNGFYGSDSGEEEPFYGP